MTIEQHVPNIIIRVALQVLLVAVAFAVAVVLPALYITVDWNLDEFHNYRVGTTSLALLLHYLWTRFTIPYSIGFLLCLTIGLPLFYILQSRIRFNLRNACLIAVVIAVAPNLVLEMISVLDGPGAFTSATGDCVVIEGGMRTACGWRYFLVDDVLFMGLLGAGAGLVFYGVIRFFKCRQPKLFPKLRS